MLQRIKMKNLLIVCAIVLILSSAAAAAAPSSKLKVVVVANSIDSALASDFFGFLKNKGKEVISANASDFGNYSNEKFIVILGGPDAPEGIGAIVRQVLSESEQNAIREKGSAKMYVKPNAFAQGQVVFVIAGSDRERTKKAHEENRDAMHAKIAEEGREVAIRGTAYSPAKLSIKKGETVRWINYDDTAHTVTKSGFFDSGALRKGDVWSYTFDREGVYDYTCTFHATMRGSVEVK